MTVGVSFQFGKTEGCGGKWGVVGVEQRVVVAKKRPRFLISGEGGAGAKRRVVGNKAPPSCVSSKGEWWTMEGLWVLLTK